MTSTEASILLLAFYQVITMGNAKASASMDEEVCSIILLINVYLLNICFL